MSGEMSPSRTCPLTMKGCAYVMASDRIGSTHPSFERGCGCGKRRVKPGVGLFLIAWLSRSQSIK